MHKLGFASAAADKLCCSQGREIAAGFDVITSNATLLPIGHLNTAEDAWGCVEVGQVGSTI